MQKTTQDRRPRSWLLIASLLPLASCDAPATSPLTPLPVLTTLAVTISAGTVQVGQTATATVAGRDQNGAPIGVGTVTWTTGSTAIAIVGANGVVTGVMPGQTEVVAAAGGKQGQANVSVVAVPDPSIVATVSALTRRTPLIGFNTNAFHATANWTMAWFRDATASLNPAVLRYPGGTPSNYWDWQTGWFQNSPTTPPQNAQETPRGTIRADEFQLGLAAAAAEPLLVVNIQNSTLSYELQGLAHAQSVGVPVRLVELGNEHNNSTTAQGIPPDTYASRVKVWADSIRAAYPGVKICAVGGAMPMNPTWHTSIFSRAPAIDALAFHFYLGAGNVDGVFNPTRALSVPFAANGGLLDRYARGGFDDPVVPSAIEVWVTEYNLGEVLADAALQHADTWTHALYVSAMSHLLMTLPRVTMLVNHNLTNVLDFAAIDPLSQRITANGVAMMLLGQASKGLPNAAPLSFAGAPQVDYQGTTYPSLIGWKFSGGSVAKVWVVNLSSSPRQVAFDQVFGGPFSYELVSGDPALQVNGRGSLTNTVGQGSGSLVLPAYSISVLVR